MFQPIIELDSGDVVAYEALARGPEGTPLERPDLLFETGRDTGRLVELDWACRGAAFTEALEHGATAPLTVFVNVEPDALDAAVPEDLTGIWRRARGELRLGVEVTERSLTARPSELLEAVATIRRLGWGVVLDDVGADPRSLALMPLLRPDVVKLDLRLVQETPTAQIAQVVSAVNAYAERVGATVLAEGIETEDQLATALAVGASAGQGYLFGRPAPLPDELTPPAHAIEFLPPPPREWGATPFRLVRRSRDVRRGTRRLLSLISRQLEDQIRPQGETGVLLASFQEARFFDAATAERYSECARMAAFTAVFGAGLPRDPVPGVRGAALGVDDELRGEWVVSVLGPHFAGALVGKDLGDAGPQAARRFDFVPTYDRDLVIAIATNLMSRIAPLGPY